MMNNPAMMQQAQQMMRSNPQMMQQAQEMMKNPQMMQKNDATIWWYGWYVNLQVLIIHIFFYYLSTCRILVLRRSFHTRLAHY